MLTTCCRDIGVFLGYLFAGTRITSTYTATIKTSFTVHLVITANNLQMVEGRLINQVCTSLKKFTPFKNACLATDIHLFPVIC